MVVGAGVSAMAFGDTLIDHSDASVTIIDRRDSPGGHWNDAYPFVRLHQPSAWYGVASRTRISLDFGTVPASASTLYIDCSAGALQHPPSVPVFDAEVINLLYVLRCRPLPSAAVIAYVESHFEEEAEKNRLCTPVGVPERPSDWLAQWSTTLNNMARWAKHPAMNSWFNACRLSSTAIMTRGADAVGASRLGLLKERSVKAGAAAPRLKELIADGQ